MLKIKAASILAALAALSVVAQTNSEEQRGLGPQARRYTSVVAQANPETQLVWSADHLETNTTASQATAEYRFGVTNISDSEVVIRDARASCGCTTAQLPAKPWHLPPHTDGEIKVSVNLAGKMGTFDKTVSIFFADTNAPHKVLRVTVKMPDRRIMRDQNTKIALADRQAVFKGECGKCHADPAKTATGHALYRQVCGICHDAHPRASTVPDLHMINHPMDYDSWKTNIANGKAGTLMPAFAASQGGPLTDAQIDELAKDCLRGMPYHPRSPAELETEQRIRLIERPEPKSGTN